MPESRLFEDNLEAIERAIAIVCRQVRLHGADAEDFASSARVALLSDDCAILRKFEGRSSMTGYVAIVVRRLFLNEKRAGGRWYASAEATRRGAAAVLFERLLVGQRRPLAEAIAETKAQYPETDPRELEATVAELPQRAPRAKLEPFGEHDDERLGGGSLADDRVREAELERTCVRASQAVRDALAAMTAQDRVILRLRFGKETAVSDIARVLDLPQRPLYRRVEALLGELRKVLERSGIAAGDIADIVEAAAGDRLDLGLDVLEKGQSGGAPPSIQMESR